MPRIVEITVPASDTNLLLSKVQNLPGLVSLRVEHNISIRPAGNVVTVTVANSVLPHLLGVLDDLGITSHQSSSVSTSRPLSLISPSAADLVRNDTTYTIWEEVDQELNKESSMSLGTLIAMACAGAIATTGILTNALHLVIGAMVIAPGFEPISRFSLGLVNRRPSWKSGLIDTVKGYSAFIVGVVLTALLLQTLGYGPDNTKASYLSEGALLSYWTSITATSLIASIAAAIAGAFLILQERSVLTAGVMIALALIPATALIGLGIAAADVSLLVSGLSRLGIEMLIVSLASMAVFGWKFKWIEKRRMSV